MEGLGFPVRGGAKPRLQLCFPARGGAVATPRPHVASPLRTLVNGLARDLGLQTNVPYRVWVQEKQVAGWTQVYSDALSYATIRGAGHEAPISQPKRSLLLFTSFLRGKPLPKALSTN
ncbi:hypothetical protein ACFX2I_044494 [Malus domestica]